MFRLLDDRSNRREKLVVTGRQEEKGGKGSIIKREKGKREGGRERDTMKEEERGERNRSRVKYRKRISVSMHSF